MDKQIDEILKETEHFLPTASDAERAYWKLSPDDRAQLPGSLRHCFDSLSE